jgi:hypothetical protein
MVPARRVGQSHAQRIAPIFTAWSRKSREQTRDFAYGFMIFDAPQPKAVSAWRHSKAFAKMSQMMNRKDRITEAAQQEIPGILEDIIYLIPVEDGDPHEASLLQGFAPSLMRNVDLIRRINMLPGNIWELTPEGQEIFLPMRMSGQAPINWFGQSRRALTSIVTPIFAPFVVVLFGEDHDLQPYRSWIEAHPFPLTVVAESGGTISYGELGIESLQRAFLNVCDALKRQVLPDALAAAREKIENWRELEERKLGYQVGGHNSTSPNLMALYAAGFRDTVYGPFQRINEGIAPYVEQITRTTRSILDERGRIGERQANQYFRRPPSLNLFAPAIYPHFREIGLAGAPMSPEARRRFLAVRRALERQEGYTLDARTEAQARALVGAGLPEEFRPHFLMQARAAELRLATECVCTLAASEISAVMRLPNSVNRTAGHVRQFAQQYHARRSTERKRLEIFRRVQDAITTSVPQEFLQFVEEADEGIRLISDAHLEWMDVRGLPLCVQKDVTRIPVTPGNLFVDQVSPKKYEHLTISDFSEILILSALQQTDPISRFFDIAIETFAPHFAEKVRLRTVRIRNSSDLIESLNSFEGAMMIFDGHGEHEPGQPATLHLPEEKLDVWKLQHNRPRIPPIVILSACNTHAADRNHASAANGFLSCGGRAVLGTVFPIVARDAASFVARLLFRVASFVPAAHSMLGRSLTWMEIMGGMIRMQLLTDFCRHLERKNIIDPDAYRAVHVVGNLAINGLKDWPFEVIVSKLAEYGVEERTAWRQLAAATANSTAISYLQVGRPETIIVHPDKGFPEEA